MNRLFWIYGELMIVHWLGVDARKHRFLNKIQYRLHEEWHDMPKHLLNEFPFKKHDEK
jgi:hypothetical protein